MGIKNFYTWFKANFGEFISPLNAGQEMSVEIDTLLLDMNGIFHESAQRIFEYGDFKPRQSFITRRRPHLHSNINTKMIMVYKDICEKIESILDVVKPKKRIVLCVDGPAPLSKQVQQRQRRFVSAKDSIESDEKGTFDSNCISPGTVFMDRLSKYIDWYIRKKLSEKNQKWYGREVVFSNEKVPGEGEHLLLAYVRKIENKEESFCIHGMDADLIMLALACKARNFWILRDEKFARDRDCSEINIYGIKRKLGEILNWTPSPQVPSETFSSKNSVFDFVLMCFLVGNDFLPNVPAMEIPRGSIDFMVDVYKKNGVKNGHLTRFIDGDVRFRKRSLANFLSVLSTYEKEILEDKVLHAEIYFRDEMLERNTTVDKDNFGNRTINVDIEAYRRDWYETHFSDVEDEEGLCHEYLEGMQWVLSYYTRGVPDWRWKYTHLHAPFAHTLAKYTKTFEFKKFEKSKPFPPFLQLVCILPPKSSNLIPSPLSEMLVEDSPLKKNWPDTFEVDFSGKKYEWEAVAILPCIDWKEVEKEYAKRVKSVDVRDRRRNVIEKSVIYVERQNFLYKSYYGDFMCTFGTEEIDL